VSGRGPGILLAAGRPAVGVRHSLTRPAKRACTPSHRPASSSGPRTAQRRQVRQYLLPDHPLPDFCTAGLGSLPPTRLHDWQQGPSDRGVRLHERQLGTRKGVSGSGAAPPTARPGGTVSSGAPSGTRAAKPKNCDVTSFSHGSLCRITTPHPLYSVVLKPNLNGAHPPGAPNADAHLTPIRLPYKLN
jgi:hypothetical protein